MMHEVTYWKLVYPKGYVPGMDYKKIRLGKTWFSDLRRMTIRTENAIWECAARLRITCDVDTFSVRQLDEVFPWFAGTL